MAAQKESISRINRVKNLTMKRLFNSISCQTNVDTIRSLLQGVDMEARDSKGRTILIYGVLFERDDILDLLITAGANVNDQCNRYQYTALHYASRHGRIDTVRLLVKKGIDLDATDVRGETAMHHASRSRKLKVVKFLLKKGADIDKKNLLGFTPLINAAQYSRTYIFHLLLYSGANFDGDERLLLYFASRNRWMETVEILVKILYPSNYSYVLNDATLDAATSSGHLQLVKFLVGKENVIDNKWNKIIRQEALYYASYMGHMEVLMWLVKKDDGIKRLPDLNLKHKSGWTALHIASDRGNLEVVKWLVKSGADINIKNHARLSPLHSAADKGHLEVVKCLVEQGIDISAKQMNGQTALLYASSAGYLDIIKYLVEKGDDINAIDDDGWSPLIMSSAHGELEVVKWLVEKEDGLKGQPIINARAKTGYTALHFASNFGHLEIVKRLVEKGAEINVKSDGGETPLFMAAEGKFKDTFDFLINLGANIDGTNLRKWTVLHLASTHGWTDTVEFLIKRGCDLEARDDKGTTALTDACINGELNIAHALLQAGARWDNAKINGCLPFKYLTDENKSIFLKLFIENGAYLNTVDYETIVKSSSLSVLQDAKLCRQAILNKFNNHDLPELYKLPVSAKLPDIDKMKIESDSEIAKVIEQTVEFEIQSNGHCNILELRPKALCVLSVEYISEYYTKITQESKNEILKRKSTFDSDKDDQHSSKSMRFC